MIIGISGKIGSGKDTVGLIIQAFMEFNLTYSEIVEIAMGELVLPKSNWEVRKFADKLKDIACILIGCTREQLEVQEFKKTVLSSEWDQYRGWSVDGIPPLDPNKTYPMTKTAKLYSTKEQAMEAVSMLHKGYDLEKMTVRAFLQKLGTDAMRNNLHENVWVNAFWIDYKGIKYAQGTAGYDPYKPKDILKYPNWIITDVRFENEYNSVKRRGGLMIKVERPGIETQSHASETGLDHITDWNYVINNSGSIEDLVREVENILKKERWI